MARATQLGTSSAAANTRPPTSAPAPSPSIARMTADTTSDLKEIKQTTHASRTQRPRLRGAGDIQCTDPAVDQEHDDHGLENKEATGRSTSRPSAVGHQGRWPLPDRGRGPSTTRPRPSTTRPTAIYNEAERAVFYNEANRPPSTTRPRAFDNSEAAGLLQLEQRGRGPAATRTQGRGPSTTRTAGRVLQQRASQLKGPSTARGRARSRRSVRRRTTPLHRKPLKHASDEGGQDLGGARNVRLRRSTANCGSMQAPPASVASAAAEAAFTKEMGSRPSRRGPQQPPTRQSPVRQGLPPQAREANCLSN